MFSISSTPSRGSSPSTVVVQKVLDLAEGVRLQLEGGVYDVIMRNRKAHELAPFMLERVAPDTSRQVLSPMPGQLISVAVRCVFQDFSSYCDSL